MPSRRTKKPNYQAFESRTSRSKFARISRDMINSPAWQSLDIYAQVLYLHLKMRYIPGKEREIRFPYQEGLKLMSNRTFIRSIDKLIEAGLIDLVEHRPFGAAYNIYGLSARWHHYGTPNFIKKTRPRFKRPL